MAEHVDDARRFSDGSHIVKHWMEEHPQMMEMPPWRFRTIRSFKDCLTRQLSEAVAISLSEDSLLNGKCDYISNCISRVTVNEDEYCKKKREIKEELEEKERLLKLEEFRREKSGHLTGVKRKTSPTLCIIGIQRKLQNTKPNMYTKPQITFLPHPQSDQLSVKDITPQILQTGLKNENLSDGWNDELYDELHSGWIEDVSENTGKTRPSDALQDGWRIYKGGEPMNKVDCIKNENFPVECATGTNPPDDEFQPELRNECKPIGGTGDHATTDQYDIKNDELHEDWISVAGGGLI